TPRAMYSFAAERVRPMTACFPALYIEAEGAPDNPLTDETLTMVPPPDRSMASISYFMQLKTPRTSIDIVLPASSKDISLAAAGTEAYAAALTAQLHRAK